MGKLTFEIEKIEGGFLLSWEHNVFGSYGEDKGKIFCTVKEGIIKEVSDKIRKKV